MGWERAGRGDGAKKQTRRVSEGNNTKIQPFTSYNIDGNVTYAFYDDTLYDGCDKTACYLLYRGE